MDTVKIVTVGDGNNGKTCLLMCYSTDTFPTEHVPTVFDNYHTTVMAGAGPNRRAGPVSVCLWDTAGQEEYDSLRVLCSMGFVNLCELDPQTDCFIITFSMVNPTSYENVRSKWIKEVRAYGNGAPVLLVGTKSDLADDVDELARLRRNGQMPITLEQAELLRREIGAERFFEASALTSKNVKSLFDCAIREGLFRDVNKSNTQIRRRKFLCNVM